MVAQPDIDAALDQAQAAVNDLAAEAGVAPRPGDEIAAPSTTPTGAPLRRILRLRVPVVVCLARRTLPMSEVIKLSGGSIIEFDRGVDEDLDLMVNRTRIGRGRAVKVGEHFGLRVSAIGDVRARLASVNEAPPPA